MDDQFTPKDTLHVGIVGFGPKGLYALAQLVAELWRKPPSGRIDVHIFEKGSHFGAGQVYRPDQPAYLKMNIPAVDVRRSIHEAFALLPEVLQSIHTAGEGYGDFAFMPRAEVGKVLAQAYAALQLALPPCVHIREWRGEVVDISRAGAFARISFGEDGWLLPYRFSQILLCTGHPGRRLEGSSHRFNEEGLKPFSCKADGWPVYAPSVYPVGALAASAKGGTTVVIRGMGLTFVDAVLALTEGRGGQFAEIASQRYRYLASGNEPKRIVPFSRSGLLMPARDARQMRYPHQLRFFTASFAERLLEDKHGSIDFEKDLWPGIEAEYLVAYYGCLMPAHGYDLMLDAGDGPEVLRSRIAAFHKRHSSLAAFEPRAYLKGLGTSMVHGVDDYHTFSKEAIAAGIDAAIAGPLRSPLASVANVWRAISPLFNTLYSGGGLKADSQRYFDREMNGQLQCLTYGPCAENMKKLLALAEAGMLDFGIGPGAKLHVEADKRLLRLESLDGKRVVEADMLVDARIPRLSLLDNMPVLYENLMATGQVRPFVNASLSGDYHPGCPDMDAKGRAIDRWGRMHGVLSFAGTPTEGYVYDNDTISPLRNNMVDAWAARVRQLMPQKQGYEYAH